MAVADNQLSGAASPGLGRIKRTFLGFISLVVAAAIWIPLLRFFYRRDASRHYAAEGISAKADELAERHLRLWRDDDLKQKEIDKMRVANAEWDFMGRTFLVLSLADMALRRPDNAPEYLSVIDRIIDETVRLEREHGHLFFLMPYARVRPFLVKPPRSLFVDGEIALMLGARRMVEENDACRLRLTERVATIVDRMRQGPVLCAESYPDQCWMFCNAAALAAVRVADVLDGTDHSAFLGEWIDTAREKLVHGETGLLVSSFSLDGTAFDGPEGSTIWMVAHCLRIVDEEFAEDQYERARRELGVELLGFGYAREWPASWVSGMDVDSGPVIPLLGASAGSSGLAFVAASSFGDTNFVSSLSASLDFAGFPSRRGGGLKYCAGNQVGDAVLLYSAVLGPVWERVLEEDTR